MLICDIRTWATCKRVESESAPLLHAISADSQHLVSRVVFSPDNVIQLALTAFWDREMQQESQVIILVG